MTPLEVEYRNLLEACGAANILAWRDGGDPIIEQRWQEVEKEVAEVMGGEGGTRQRSDRSLTKVLQMTFDFVRKAAAEYSMSCPIDVLVGEFPTGSFNAQAIRVEQGALLLINNGLMMFIHQCAKIYVHSIPINVVGGQGQKNMLPARLERSESIDALADVLTAYLFGHPTLAPRLPINDRIRFELTSQMTSHAEWFVIGHEYGHAIAGHLTEPKSLRRVVDKSGGSIEFVSKSWEEEIEADALGLAFLIPPSVRGPEPSSVDLHYFGSRIAGPFLFFALDDLIQCTLDQLAGTQDRFDLTHDHPPTVARLAGMFEALQDRGTSPHLSTARNVINWFREIAPDVSSVVCARFSRW